MKRKLMLLIPVVIALVYACANQAGAPVKYKIGYYEKKFGECNPDNFSNCVRINFEYPEINFSPSAALKDSAKKYIMEFLLSPVMGEKPASGFDEIADSIISDFKRLKRDFPDAPAGYMLERNVTVLFNSDEILSLEMKEYSFMGGAHPNTMIYFVNFDRTGNVLTLGDLFVEDYQAELNSAGEIEFRKTRELTEGESLGKAGFWFKDDKFSLNENFLIQKEGLKFLFNNYEVAPYSMGRTEFVIPYTSIEKIIKKDGPLNGLIE